MFCTKCGSQIADNARFCPGCGAPVTASQAPEQIPYSASPQQAAYEPPSQQVHFAPAKQTAGKTLSIGVLIGIIAGGLALALLVFFGLRYLTSRDNKGGAASPKSVQGIWEGMLRFDEWFPEDGTSSALVYASGDGNLPCTLNVSENGRAAELVVGKVTIPLAVEEGEDALRLSGTMGAEELILDASLNDNATDMTGSGSVTVGSETVPFSFGFSQVSDEAPELTGADGALPEPPAGGAAAVPAEPDGAPVGGETEIGPNGDGDFTPQSEQKPLALEGVLPGTWVTNPDQDFCVTVFAFDPNGLMGHGIACSSGETTLENWDENGIWELGGLTWRNWSIQGEQVTFEGRDNTDIVRIVPKNEEWIVVYYEGSDEGYEFHRMGEAPGLEDYFLGDWMPDEANENGVQAVLALEPNGIAVMTAVKGKGNVSPADWGDESKWEILGAKEGSWRVQDGQFIISMDDNDEAYGITINGPDNVLFQYGASSRITYTRVS